MFKKLAVFTDIHFGLKSNSKLHNDDCEEFIDWYIDLAKQHGCETGMFCGDWHHNRNSVNITTMDASIRSLEKIGKAFDKFYFFPGNHDLYYKDSRDIQSTEFGRFIPGITMVNEITKIDDVVMVPWLVGNEWKKVGKMKWGMEKPNDHQPPSGRPSGRRFRRLHAESLKFCEGKCHSRRWAVWGFGFWARGRHKQEQNIVLQSSHRGRKTYYKKTMPLHH